ncbi:hypothetical protein ACHAXT_009734 [Thalassiosira profunda]
MEEDSSTYEAAGDGAGTAAEASTAASVSSFIGDVGGTNDGYQLAEDGASSTAEKAEEPSSSSSPAPFDITTADDSYHLAEDDAATAATTGGGDAWLEQHALTKVPPALLPTGKILGGVLREYRARYAPRVLLSDWTDGWTWKTKSASLFMFCATFASTVALGEVAFRETEGRVGISEYLMLQSVAGMAHSLFSACPMPILRPTGPITAFMGDLFGLSSYLDVNYYSLLSWVGMWVGLGLIAIAAFDLSRYIVLCTRFLHEIYAAFVCTIYIADGIQGVVERFSSGQWDQAFFAFYLALSCVLIALLTYYFDRFHLLFNRRWRHALSDYAVPIAVLICIWISYAAEGNVQVERLSMPRNFQPTYPPSNEYGEGYSYLNSDFESGGIKRSWYQGLGFGDGDGLKLFFVSLGAAIPIISLFYIDHLFSCLLGQKKELGLTKGEYYHSSMLVTGLCNLILPSFGMPFVTASLPHSPQFTKALTDYDKTTSPPKVIKVHESRVAPFVVYLLCFFGLVFPAILELCPVGVVNGILAFVGLQGILPFTGNQFIDRCVLLFTHPSEFPTASSQEPSSYLKLPWYRIHLYTCAQILCLLACWGMRFTGPFALAFPLVVVGFIPLRLYVLPKYFTPEELELLDAEGGDEGKETTDAAICKKEMLTGTADADDYLTLPVWRSWMS